MLFHVIWNNVPDELEPDSRQHGIGVHLIYNTPVY